MVNFFFHLDSDPIVSLVLSSLDFSWVIMGIITGIVFSCHLSKNDTYYRDSCQNSGLFKMKPLIGKSCGTPCAKRDDQKLWTQRHERF